MTFKQGKRLRIFTSESHKVGTMPLSEWLLAEALKQNLEGATTLRGAAGFGHKHHMHTTKILSLSSNLPIIVEIVDTTKNIEIFLSIIDTTISDCLVTLEDIQILNKHNKESD